MRLISRICFIVFPVAISLASLSLIYYSSLYPAQPTVPKLLHMQIHKNDVRPSSGVAAKLNPTLKFEAFQGILNLPNPEDNADTLFVQFPQTPQKEMMSARFQGGCVIPIFQPHDAVTKMFSRKLPPPECSGEPWLTETVGGTLFLNVSLLKSRQEKADNCSYEEIRRLRDEEVVFAQPVAFRDGVHPNADFVRVQCGVINLVTKKRSKYTAYHFLMQEKPALEQTLQMRLRERKLRPRDSNVSPKTWASSLDWVNVIMLGVDSTSRHNMIRLMPKTRHFLLNELRAVEMTNYNKVADNTFPNMFALHTGLTLDDARWAETLEKARGQQKREVVDWETLGYRFLCQDFAQQGYRTLYNEDLYRINTFYVENISFREPTYCYGRTLEMAKEKYSSMFSQDGRCFGGKSSDRLMLSYPLEYIRLFRNKPHFSLNFLVRTTHNNLNGPGQVDDAVSAFLSTLQGEGLANNTVLLVYSDHGVRIGPFRNTAAGKFEESRPFMFLAFPDRFRKQFPHLTERVQSNAARFTTHLDVHATLLDLLFLNHVDPLQDQRPKNRHGISLFKTIPTSRTCVDAGIPAHHCVCLTERPLSATSPLALAAGTTVTATLNAAISSVRHKCHSMTLSEITGFVQLQGQENYLQRYCRAEQQSQSLEGISAAGSKGLYRVTIVVEPSRGLFEATLAKCGEDLPFRFIDDYADISRFNKYGNTSWCVEESRFLPKICYCKRPQ
ncbi:hypothetical protein ACOMHN_059078 [Nucella lapillus]